MNKNKTKKTQYVLRITLFLFFFFSSVFSQHISLPGADQDSAIEEIIQKQEHIRTIAAEFVQEKYSTMAKEPLHWKGTFYYMTPNKVAWLYNRQIKMVSDGETLTLYYPELQMAEMIPVEQNKIQLPLNFTLNELKKYFHFSLAKEEGLNHVTLTPIDEDTSLLKKMIITLSDKAIPITVEIFEKGGDRSLITFTNQQINRELSMKHFTLQLPHDTTIRRSP